MRTLLVLIACCLPAPRARAQAVELRAGVARVEITPSELMPMYGYANRKCGPANGTHDPLFAKALVLGSPEARLAIVTLDLGTLMSESLSKEVAEKLGIPTLLVAASHTHSGPVFQQTSAYQAEVERKVFGAVREAAGAMFPAKLGVGRGSLQLGYNRLLVRDDGRARAVFDNLERIPYGPVDPEFVLLRVEDPSGAPRALVAHYACHAVVLGPTSCKYSADWPGVMQARVESEFSGAQCMFVQGGAGDINPLFLGRTGKEEEDFKTMQKMGELAAAQVVKIGRGLRADPALGGPIQAGREVLKFAERWDKDKSLEVAIATVLIGREVAIAAVPGEPMVQLQTIWKTRADVRHPLFYGYTYAGAGAWAGYVPDLRTAAYGGYGADVTTRIEIGAGEAIMERHLIVLYRMLGMWKDKPGRP